MKRLFGLVAFLAVFLTACATNPKMDWQSRVGNYTYDQAVLELGPPDKEAQITDGTRVAEWLTYRGRSGGAWVSYTRHGWISSMDTPQPDYYLRLTFEPNGKLQSWKKYVK